MKKLIIYSKVACGQCNQAKMYMTARKIPFEVRDIEENPVYMEELLAYGVSSLPLITNGVTHMTGFNPLKVSELYDELA